MQENVQCNKFLPQNELNIEMCYERIIIYLSKIQIQAKVILNFSLNKPLLGLRKKVTVDYSELNVGKDFIIMRKKSTNKLKVKV